MKLPFWLRCIFVLVSLLVPLTSVSQKVTTWSHSRNVKATDRLPPQSTIAARPIRTKIQELDHQISMKEIDRAALGFCPTTGHPSKNCKRIRNDSREQDLRVMALCASMKRSDVPADRDHALEVCAKPK